MKTIKQIISHQGCLIALDDRGLLWYGDTSGRSLHHIEWYAMAGPT